MSNQIEKAYINNFRTGFEQAFQKETSVLRPFVEIERQTAEFDFYDRVGIADDMQEVTSRYGDNPVNEVPHDRRMISLKDWDWGKPIDEKDLIRVATDPTNAYTTAAVAAAHRKVDTIINERLFVPAATGKKGDIPVSFVGTTSGKITVGAISNPAGLIATAGVFSLTAGSYEGIDIAKDYTGGAAADSGLTLAKLKGIRKAMMRTKGVKENDIIDFFYTSNQQDDLLGISEVINSDFSTRKNLAEGNVASFLGFRFHILEELPLASAGVRQCFAIAGKKAFKLAIGTDITTDMWRLSGQKNIPYIYIKMSMGGSRMWGEILAKVNCVEA